MRKSIIPPRTMRDISRQTARSRSIANPAPGSLSSLRASQAKPAQSSDATAPASTGLFRKPRNWRFQTKPLFKKLHGPLIDVFDEADEILIVIDLSGFQPGDVSFRLTQEKYLIHARRGNEVYHEEIQLPTEVDLANCVEHFRNGILEISLPRQRKTNHSEGEP